MDLWDSFELCLVLYFAILKNGWNIFYIDFHKKITFRQKL